MINSHAIQNWDSLGRVVSTILHHILFIKNIVVRVVIHHQELLGHTENLDYHVTDMAAGRKLQYGDTKYN